MQVLVIIFQNRYNKLIEGNQVKEMNADLHDPLLTMTFGLNMFYNVELIEAWLLNLIDFFPYMSNDGGYGDWSDR